MTSVLTSSLTVVGRMRLVEPESTTVDRKTVGPSDVETTVSYVLLPSWSLVKLRPVRVTS